MNLMSKRSGFIQHRSGAGFTLIELMVAISIIAILSIVGIVVYSSVLKNSRDAKRISDLKFIQSALEDYHADQLVYPDRVVFGSPLMFTNTAGNVKTYLNLVPSDPLSPNLSYNYVATPNNCDNTINNTCTSYCLYTSLEGSSVPISDSGCTGEGYGVTRP